MRACFRHAISPPKRRCLGLTLQPLTLGHLFLLSEIESPLLLSSEPITIPDLALAAFVCAQRHTESRRDMRRWWFPLFAALLGFIARRKDIQKEIDTFGEYIKQSTELPPTKRRVNSLVELEIEPPEAPIPHHWHMLSILMEVFHCTRAEALDFPMQEAELLWMAKLDREGQLNLRNAEDEAFDDYCRMMDARETSIERRN